jgi:predicted permease
VTIPPDLRYAARAASRNPRFAAMVILILAIGIGANTAMFTLVDSVLVQPLPFRDPSRLVAVQESVPRFNSGEPPVPVNAVHFLEWRKHWQSAEELALLATVTFNLMSDGDPESVVAGRVSWNLFPLLGVQPRLGRAFLPEEDRPGRDLEVVLSDSLWRRRFHADPEVSGQKILLNGVPYEVVGVLPPLELPRVSQLQSMSFGNAAPELWKPFALRDQEMSPMGDFNYACIARLKPGVSIGHASAELNQAQSNIGREIAGNVELRAAVTPLQEQIAGRSRQGLMLLMLAVVAVLLIVCVNVANLLLARAAGRARELAVRAALGASAGRLLRQTLAEIFLMALPGGALGLAFAAAALRFIVARAPADLPRLNEVRLDWRAVAVTFGLSFISAAICGWLPAWRASRADPQPSLRSGGRSSTENRNSRRVRSLLVAVETGLCTICLAAAGLLLNSFVRLLHVDKGFDTGHVVTVDLNLPASRYPDLDHRSEFLRRAIEAARTLPGVAAASVSNLLPLAGEGSNNIVNLDGDTTPVQQRPIADFRLIGEEFFRAIGIPLLEGRTFEAADRPRRVAVISAALARRLWLNQDPLGKRFHLGDPNGPSIEVVGVAGDVRGVSLQKQPNPTVYLPYWQRNNTGLSLVVRTEMDPSGIAQALRTRLRGLDPELPVGQFRALDEIVSASLAQRRFQLNLVLLFAAIGLALASLGIYGVVSYSVAQRLGEMGIRMALGATGSDLRSLVLRQGLEPVFAGIAFGLAGSVGAGRLLSGLLFGVNATDPPTLAFVTAVLLSIAAAACYLPALRATRSDALPALHSD